MKRKTILYIAMTLDGYIADEQDQLTFLDAYHHIKFTNQTYAKLLKRIDTIIMGRKTYDILQTLVEKWPYSDQQTYVLTSTLSKSPVDSITYVNYNIEEFMKNLILSDGKDIWIVGGGKVVQTLLDMNLIDEFHITIIPKLLGGGKPLFRPLNHILDLELEEVITDDNLVMLIYNRKQ